jgi:hypothetical protein
MFHYELNMRTASRELWFCLRPKTIHWTLGRAESNCFVPVSDQLSPIFARFLLQVERACSFAHALQETRHYWRRGLWQDKSSQCLYSGLFPDGELSQTPLNLRRSQLTVTQRYVSITSTRHRASRSLFTSDCCPRSPPFSKIT